MLPAIDGVKWYGVRRPLKRARAASAAPRTWRCCLCRLLHGLVQLSTPAFASWVIGQVCARATVSCTSLAMRNNLTGLPSNTCTVFSRKRLAFRTDTSTHLVSVLHLVLNATQLACTCTHWPSFNTPVLCLGGAQVLQEGLAAASLRYEQLAPSPQLLPHFVADVLHLTCTAYMFTLQRPLPTMTDLLASSKVGEGSATINKNRHRFQSTPTLQASAVAKPLTFAIQCADTHTHTPVVITMLNAGP